MSTDEKELKTMFNGLKIVQAAALLGVSQTTVYKKLKRLKTELEGKVHKQNGVILLTEEAVEIIRNDLPQAAVGNNDGVFNRLNKVENTFKTETATAGGNASNNEAFNQLKTELKSSIDFLRAELGSKDEIIKRFMAQQENDRKFYADERHRTDTIIMQLTTQLKETRVLLDDLREQVQAEPVPEYETVDARTGPDDIMEVNAVGEELVQDVVVKACEEPPAAAPAPAGVALEAKEQGPTPVMETVAQKIEPEGQGIAAAAVAETRPAKPSKVIEKQAHPKHTWGMFKRLWVNMFQPELLRET